MSMYERSELEIHPEFQRFYRWTHRQKVNFIESILLRIPLPGIFVAQRSDAVWDVIDGLQRLSTIFEFTGTLKDAKGDLRPPLNLSATEYIPELEGVRYDTGERSLTPVQRIDFRRQKLDVKIILEESDPDAKYDLFTRLNTGGTPLSPQEVRSAVMLMINSAFYEWFDRLSRDPAFHKLISVSPREQQERYDGELLLRYLSFRRLQAGQERLADDVADFLNSQARALAADSALNQGEEERTARRTFELLSTALPKGTLHDGETDEHDLNEKLFDAVTVGLSLHLAKFEAQPGDDTVKRIAAAVAKCRAAGVDKMPAKERLQIGNDAFGNV